MKLFIRTTFVKDGEIKKETFEAEGYKEALEIANGYDADSIVVVSVDIYHA